MNTLVLYFSYGGNNRLLAEYLADTLKADLCPVEERKRRTALTIMLDMMLKREPKLKPLAKQVTDYSRVILVCPLWDSKLANPFRTAIKEQVGSLREYAFISFCGYERPSQRSLIKQELTELLGHEPRVSEEIHVGDLFPEDKRQNVRLITGYHAKPEDLVHFRAQLEAFVAELEKAKVTA